MLATVRIVKVFSSRCWKDVKPSVKYTAIYKNKGKFEIALMCRFFEVSRSGYYAWEARQGQADKDEVIGHLINQCQEQTNRTYGYRRMKLWLLRETGLIINSKAVLRLMRKYDLLAEIRRPRPLYQRQQQLQVYENRLNRDFHADRSNQKWVTDISYIPTKQGNLYLSMIKDLYDNFIVAYDTATVQDNHLVYRTIQMAKKRSPME